MSKNPSDILGDLSSHSSDEIQRAITEAGLMNENGLLYKDEGIREFVVRQFTSMKTVPPVDLGTLFGLIADDNMRIASLVAKNIVELCKLSGFLESNAALLQKILVTGAKSGDDNVRFRAFDVAFQIAALSESALFFVRDSGILGLVVDALSADDVLVHMVTIEQLSMLSRTAHGMQFLSASGVYNRFVQLLNATSVFGPMACTIMRHIQDMCWKRNDATELVIQHGLLAAVFARLDSDDTEMASSALAATGAMGSTTAGLAALMQDNTASSVFAEACLGRDTNTRVSALHSLARIVEVDHTAAGVPAFSAPREQEQLWKKIPCEAYTNELLSLVKKPIPELRFAVFDVMNAAVKHLWGIRALFSFSDFRTFLMNRNTEETKEGREWKFTIVQTVLQHKSELEHLLGSQTHKDLLVYHKLGPMFAEAQAGVAVYDDHA